MTTTHEFVLPTADNMDELYTEEEQKKIYEALKAKFALGHPYDNTPHTYCEECDCCIACDCCVCDGEGGQLHECPACENSFSDAQIESGEVVPCVRCDKCFVGECGKTKCDCVFDDDDDNFTDCEDCGYTHLCEDKCPNEATACHYEKWREEGESDDSWEPDCCKCGTTTDSKGMGGVELREDLDGWYCGRCYEHHKTPEPKEHQPTFIITVRRKKTSKQ